MKQGFYCLGRGLAVGMLAIGCNATGGAASGGEMLSADREDASMDASSVNGHLVLLANQLRHVNETALVVRDEQIAFNFAVDNPDIVAASPCRYVDAGRCDNDAGIDGPYTYVIAGPSQNVSSAWWAFRALDAGSTLITLTRTYPLGGGGSGTQQFVTTLVINTAADAGKQSP